MRISDWSSDVCSSDLPVAEWPNVLTALNAVILLRSIDGMRSVPIREFLIGYLTTGLEPGEILVGVEIPRPARSQRAGISKLCRKAGEFAHRSEEHTSELQSLMRISYAVFCLKKKTTNICIKHIN